MKLPLFIGMAGVFAMFSSAAFGWSLSGQVIGENGQGVSEVAIASFNYSGVSATSDEAGFFTVSNENSAGIGRNVGNQGKFGVHYNGSTLSISGSEHKVFKVSLMDALGKVAFQQDFSAGNAEIDLRKFAHQKMMILRVGSANTSENYILDKNGATRALRKAGDQPASLSFSKDGYDMAVYTMTSEVETDIKVTLKKSLATNQSSSSSAITSSSERSSSSVHSSSSTGQADVKPSTVLAPRDYDKYIGSRKYILHVPSTYKGDKPVPLLVDFHPIFGSAGNWFGSSPYKSTTDQEGVITVYPDGGMSPLGGQAWNIGSCCTDEDDEAFTRAIVKAVKEVAYIDSKRIYAAGFSMGGGMSHYAACTMADIFAAVAPASMDLATQNTPNCNPSRPISVIAFRGTNDGTVAYQGAASTMVPGKPLTFLGAEENHKFWAQKNQCQGNPIRDANGCSTYENCAAGTKVTLCTNMGTASCSGNGHDAGCPRIGWPFLKQFTMP